jgi:hypothetical protein
VSDFELKPVHGVKLPGYPAAERPGGEPKALISNRAAGFLPIALVALAPVAGAATRGPDPVVVQEAARGRAQESAKPALQRLSEAEVTDLIGAAADVREFRGMEIRGKVAVRSSFLTEQEAKGLLAAFLKKNGFDAAAGRVGGVALDSVDATRRVGVKLVRDGGIADLDEIALLKARGEARVLVLDSRNFEYDDQGYFANRLPTKRGAAYALLAELERFLNE